MEGKPENRIGFNSIKFKEDLADWWIECIMKIRSYNSSEVLMNRKVSRFVAKAIEHYWESHYIDDEITWDDLKYIFEQLKEYGNSTHEG
jgi:hypothetical protein